MAIAVTYLMLLLVVVVMSLAALTISMMTDQPRAGGVLLLLSLILVPAWTLAIGAGGDSRFPGLTALLVVLGLLPLYHVTPTPYDPFIHLMRVPFFGVQVPSLFVSVVLYVTAGAWLLLMLVRNLKKDREDIRLLSRSQAVGLTAYLNVLVFALLDLQPVYSNASNRMEPASASDVAVGYLALNFLILYAVGLATLTPPGRLKSWSRRSASSAQLYWSEDGPNWPWMAASSVAAFLLFLLEAVVSRHFIPFSQWPVGTVAGQLFILLVFAVRDVLFLQWCALKSFRSPVVRGMLFLVLYYTTAFTVAGLFFHPALAWFTPIGAFGGAELATPVSITVGVLLQVGASIYLVFTIRQLLAPPAASSAVASAPAGS